MAHPPGADDTEHPGIHEDADVMGNGALRPVDGGGQLGHRGGPLEH